MGTLKTEPARTRLDLLAPPVAAAVQAWPDEAPVDWPILVDSRLIATPHVIIGSGVRHSKIARGEGGGGSSQTGLGPHPHRSCST